MKIKLICVGSKMPAWVNTGVDEYRKRLPSDFELIIKEIPLPVRGKNADLKRAMEKEAQGILQAIDKNDFVVALDVLGKSLATETLAEELNRVRDSGQNLALLIGGPDGLADSCVQAANARWSLSALTFPHPIVRVVVSEQIYRAWSILQNHPYHRS